MKPNEHYMDYTGSSVYCQSQIEQVGLEVMCGVCVSRTGTVESRGMFCASRWQVLRCVWSTVCIARAVPI
jgi:hypothetical protein